MTRFLNFILLQHFVIFFQRAAEWTNLWCLACVLKSLFSRGGVQRCLMVSLLAKLMSVQLELFRDWKSLNYWWREKAGNEKSHSLGGQERRIQCKEEFSLFRCHHRHELVRNSSSLELEKRGVSSSSPLQFLIKSSKSDKMEDKKGKCKINIKKIASDLTEHFISSQHVPMAYVSSYQSSRILSVWFRQPARSRQSNEGHINSVYHRRDRHQQM